ncbi:acyltransferase [Priestia megaterium]|uniref:acyltransferase n=1 Tax=Priestia megaterium TaxID=1404 RepID=UPI00159B863F|nr:acyltransferase family protein [Priestia megaterium]
MRRNIGIDCLKILACFGVVVLHVSGIIATNLEVPFSFSNFLYYCGTVSVPIFFVVNGFFLLNKTEINYIYIKKKIINILFVIFIWNSLVWLLRIVVGKSSENIFLMTINSLIQEGYFFQFWFFGSLIIIYLMLPILHKVAQGTKQIIIFTSIIIMVTWTIDITSLLNKSPMQSNIIQTFRIWSWLSYYLIGGILGNDGIRGKLYTKFSRKVNLIVLLVLVFLTNFYEFFVAHYVYHNPYAEFFYDNIFIMLLVISLFLYGERIVFSNHKLVKLINLSASSIMGVYILHITIIKVFLHFNPFNNVMSNTFLIIIVFLISLCISVAISRIPFINKLVKL